MTVILILNGIFRLQPLYFAVLNAYFPHITFIILSGFYHIAVEMCYRQLQLLPSCNLHHAECYHIAVQICYKLLQHHNDERGINGTIFPSLVNSDDMTRSRPMKYLDRKMVALSPCGSSYYC